MAAKPSCIFLRRPPISTRVADLIVHLGAEAAELIAYVGADVLAFFFDETGKLLELGLFVFRHASQYTILRARHKLQAPKARPVDLQSECARRRRRICKVGRDFSGVGLAKLGAGEAGVGFARFGGSRGAGLITKCWRCAALRRCRWRS
jgi:hypothetical protein